MIFLFKLIPIVGTLVCLAGLVGIGLMAKVLLPSMSNPKLVSANDHNDQIADVSGGDYHDDTADQHITYEHTEVANIQSIFSVVDEVLPNRNCFDSRHRTQQSIKKSDRISLSVTEQQSHEVNVDAEMNAKAPRIVKEINTRFLTNLARNPRPVKGPGKPNIKSWNK